MKIAFILLSAILIAICNPAESFAQSAAAWENSGCRASFDRECYAETTTSTTAEAPMPLAAATPLGALVLGGAVLLISRRYRKQAARLADDV